MAELGILGKSYANQGVAGRKPMPAHHDRAKKGSDPFFDPSLRQSGKGI
jgi:hypothetical protein